MTPHTNPNLVIWEVRQPAETHFRVATCKETNCPHWLTGWKTLIDERTQFGQAQANYIRRESGRHFTEAKDEAGMTLFTFPPDQRCFRQHKVSLERDAIFLKSGRLMWGQDWIDDNKETLYQLRHQFEKG